LSAPLRAMPVLTCAYSREALGDCVAAMAFVAELRA
jgi:hypothetical protein